MAKIHPSSVVSKEAELAEDVVVGPFCVIAGKVRLGAGCVLESHVSIGNEWGIVEIGERNRFAAGSAVGGPPQDLSYKGEPTRVVMGHDNVIREAVTINCGTAKGGAVTRIGNHCLIMAYTHIAHDCQIGNHVVIANVAQLAGHVVFEDHVKVGGFCAFNQYVKVGQYAFIAGDAAVNKDVLPYTIAQGKYAVMRAANKIGMERSGFDKEAVESIARATRIITKGGGTVDEAMARIRQECAPCAALDAFLKFAMESSRGLAL